MSYVSSSCIDPIGRVFFYKERLFRTICCPSSAALYQKFILEDVFQDAKSIGLVNTWIPEDIEFNNANILLEHEVLNFASHAAELTAESLWKAANMIVNLNNLLLSFFLQLKDCHPWNVMMKYGQPIYIDFGSIVAYKEFNLLWYEEFKKFYLIPLWLYKNYGEKASNEYRKEHCTGFGHYFMTKVFPTDQFDFPRFTGKVSDRVTISAFFEDVKNWLILNQPVANKKKWAGYIQSGDDQNPLKPISIKHKFVFDEISRIRPKKVLDMASNKGFYSEVAARLGAKVISFDNEEFNVNKCNQVAEQHHLNITAVLLDFLHPTPPSGIGLSFPSAYDRFQADMLLVLGFIHHICIGMGVSLTLFSKILLSYKPNNIIIEFVYADDVHVTNWKKSIPLDYSRSALNNLMDNEGFLISSEVCVEYKGVHRDIVLFSKVI
ncbi:hypothetical protein [Methylomicrobium alcaliphilum]|uniref:hypothetical protein n=1 Tax=Methylotuvimicrobium alcaliphilum TaxID=271065 RepID=UPI0013A07E1F